jgi:hypothetical protein
MESTVPKAVDTNTTPGTPLLSGTAALTMLDIQHHLTQLADVALGHLDTNLVLLGQEFFSKRALYLTLYYEHADVDDHPDEVAAHRDYWTAVHQMVATPVAGIIGLMAKARVIQSYITGSDGAMDELVGSLTADCIRLAGGAQ